MIFLIMLAFASDIDAQRRGKKKSREKERDRDTEREVIMRSDFADKLTYEILIGNAGLSFGNPFQIGLKPTVAYKVKERIALGIAGKYNYFFFNDVNSPDISFSDLGVGLFGKISIFPGLFAQVEYDFNWYHNPGSDLKENFNGALVGLGYLQGYGDWKFGITALFRASNSLRDYNRFGQNSIFELYVGAHYNF